MTQVFKEYTTHAFTNEESVDYELLKNICAKYEIQLTNIFPTNAGMIALIFQGVNIKTNEKVIIKIKKKDIDIRIHTGCEEICFLYKYLRYLSTKTFIKEEDSFIDLLKPFIDNIDNLKKQCDFEREIAILDETQENLGILGEFISIPRCYNAEDDRRFDTNFIIMQFMEGEHEIPHSSNEDAMEYARILALYHMYHTMRPYHPLNMDLHQGNILLTRDAMNRPHLNIIDFGMSEELDKEESSGFSRVLHITHDYVKNGEKGVDICSKYDIVSCFEVMFESADFIRRLKKVERTRLNDIFGSFIVKIMTGKEETDHKIMYDVLKAVAQVTGEEVKFKRNTYNYVLGMAIGHKYLVEKVQYDMMKIVQIHKKNLDFLLGYDDDEDEDYI